MLQNAPADMRDDLASGRGLDGYYGAGCVTEEPIRFEKGLFFCEEAPEIAPHDQSGRAATLSVGSTGGTLSLDGETHFSAPLRLTPNSCHRCSANSAFNSQEK